MNTHSRFSNPPKDSEGFVAFFTRITDPHAQSWVRWDCGMKKSMHASNPNLEHEQKQ